MDDQTASGGTKCVLLKYSGMEIDASEELILNIKQSIK